MPWSRCVYTRMHVCVQSYIHHLYSITGATPARRGTYIIIIIVHGLVLVLVIIIDFLEGQGRIIDCGDTGPCPRPCPCVAPRATPRKPEEG